VKRFLDALDPDATGRLVRNLGEDLAGAGPSLNYALRGLGDLATTVAEKDEELGRIVDQFDRFTATIRTREQQLGRVMDDFAKLTAVLAEERRAIEGIVRGLATVGTSAIGLVDEHSERLGRDIAVLTRTLQSAIANIDSVRNVLDAGPNIVNGFTEAVDPTYHRIDLRTQFTPLVQEALNKVLGPLGFPTPPGICIPADVGCQLPGAGAGSRAARPSSRGTAERIGGGLLGVGRFVRRSVHTIMGAAS
jgi:ABC-type transporter Mla subunit MlaD